MTLRPLLATFAGLLIATSCAPLAGPVTDEGTGGSTSDGEPGTGGSTPGGSQTGGGSSLGGAGGSASSFHQVGPCTFEDAALAEDVREQVPYGDVANLLGMSNFTTGEGVSSLEGLECLAGLTDLTLEGGLAAGALDLHALAELDLLSSLRLYGGQYRNVEVLPTLSLGYLQLSDLGWTSVDVLTDANIGALGIEHMPATDLSALPTIRNLTSLNIVATSTTDLAPLASIRALSDVMLAHVPAEELPALGELADLQWLGLLDMPITHLEGLAGAPALGIIEITSAPELESLAGLEGLPNLYRLTIRETGLSDVSALAGSPSLVHVDLEHCAIEDISALGTCEILSNLSLSDNRIVDVAPLASSNVQLLWLDSNQIVDLEPLSGATVQRLNISDNPVESLDPIGTLDELTSLFMRNVGATSLEFLAEHELTELDASENALEDVSVLGDMPLSKLDLRDNDITSLPDGFVGGTGGCSLTNLEGNPLDQAAQDRLASLCAATQEDSYSWDGGSCDYCILLK